MRRKTIKVLIAYDDPTILQYLSIEIPRSYATLNVYVHLITATTFKKTKEIIERQEIDIPFIGFNWEDEDGMGADLIELIRKKSPQQLIVAILENQNSHRQLKNPDRYYPIMYPTRDLFFSELVTYLEQTLLNLTPQTQQLIIDTHTKVIHFNLEEIAYIYGHGGKTTIFTYDFDAKNYREFEVPVSLTHFLAKYNKSNAFIKCHRDYAVNWTMIRFVHKSREYQFIELIDHDENDYPVVTPMSDSFKKSVLKAMTKKGVDWE